MKNKESKIIDMSKVAKDIISMKISSRDSINTIRSKFYKILLKHSIKQGEAHKDEQGEVVSVTRNRSEWVMATELFKMKLTSWIDIQDMLGTIPKKLQY